MRVRTRAFVNTIMNLAVLLPFQTPSAQLCDHDIEGISRPEKR
jgi:hypothetical protein